MLKLRIITALILAPLVVWGVLGLATPHFALLLGVVFALGAWEWGTLAAFANRTAQGVFVAVIAAAMYGLYSLTAQQAHLIYLVGAGVVWWMMALVWVIRYPNGAGLWRNSVVARTVAGVMIMLPAWLALVSLHRDAPGVALLVMVLMWSADSGAYFAGKAFGRRKLAPRVSPGKSWEGVFGGIVVALLAGAVGLYLLTDSFNGLPLFLGLVAVTVAVSVLGDLTESLFKRIMDVKDSGGLLPGHGGILDRIDSLMAAAPVFWLGLVLLGAPWH